ncbi:hypothetical protein ACFZC6_01855 [Streptomyces ossamyceticus]|uniref:hypothetical protein n=1 Tax=Streptomyces ossamyceticus TaxID=249581 RepID=UPI0036ED98FE
MSEEARKIASLTAELHDRHTENQQLRKEIGRALTLVEAGDVRAAAALLRLLARAGRTTDPTG